MDHRDLSVSNFSEYSADLKGARKSNWIEMKKVNKQCLLESADLSFEKKI